MWVILFLEAKLKQTIKINKFMVLRLKASMLLLEDLVTTDLYLV